MVFIGGVHIVNIFKRWSKAHFAGKSFRPLLFFSITAFPFRPKPPTTKHDKKHVLERSNDFVWLFWEKKSLGFQTDTNCILPPRFLKLFSKNWSRMFSILMFQPNKICNGTRIYFSNMRRIVEKMVSILPMTISSTKSRCVATNRNRKKTMTNLYFPMFLPPRPSSKILLSSHRLMKSRTICVSFARNGIKPNALIVGSKRTRLWDVLQNRLEFFWLDATFCQTCGLRLHLCEQCPFFWYAGFHIKSNGLNNEDKTNVFFAIMPNTWIRRFSCNLQRNGFCN